MRAMALDPGTRRIGLAVSDELGALARPVAVIERSSRAHDLEVLGRFIEELEPRELVVGLPLLPSGDAGLQARYSRRFAELLCEHFGLPVRLWNESYSTVEARRRRSSRPRRRIRDRWVDAEAAAVFLQEYLDAQLR